MFDRLFFRPKLIEACRGYTRERLFADLAAGGTVGIVALPLAMAFAIASGVSPQAGLLTAVIAGFLISALGGSRVQIGGPTGAFVVIVYGIVVQYGLENLYLCTVMAGIILLVMGFCRMGSMIKYIPHPVTIGFTNGIAVLIFSTQIKDFFGLRMAEVPADFFGKAAALGRHLDTLHAPTLGLAVLSIAIIKLWPARLARRVPGSIVALVAGTLLVAWAGWPTETIGSRFGGIPQGFPLPRVPDFEWAKIRELIQPATTIALLAAIESLLSAVVADGMIDDRHDSNKELVAQGVANCVVPFFGGIPVTGAIARTATNVRNGATSPVAGIVHALVLLAILLAAAPLAAHIPLATLSAVLVMVALNMGEWQEFRLLRRYPKGDSAVFLVTFGLTVAFDLTIAVEVGMVLAAVLFIRRISENTQVTSVDEATETEGDHHSVKGKEVPPGVVIYRVFGALFFGVVDKLENALNRARSEHEVLILRMHKVLAMDATALNALEALYEKLRRRGKYLVLSGPHTQPFALMANSGFLDRLGQENVAPHLDAALERARQLLGRRLPAEPGGRGAEASASEEERRLPAD